MPNVRSCRAFFYHAILRQNQWLEIELQFAPNFYVSETRPICISIFGMRFGYILSLAFLNSSSVAAFRGPNSDSRDGVCFATSRQASEIIAPEAPQSHAVFLSIRQDACWINEWRRSYANASSEGERCMKDTDHPIRALCVTLRFSEGSEGQEVTQGTTINLGAGKTPDWAGATPHLGLSAAQRPRGVAPAQCWQEEFANSVFCPRQEKRDQ